MIDERPSRPFGRAAGVTWLALYLLLTTVHLGGLCWLMLLPHGPRERWGLRLALAPFGRYSAWFAGLRLTVHGGTHLPAAQSGYLYVVNHESVLDIPLLLLAVHRPFLMKHSLRVTPIGWGATYAGSITVRRDSPESRVRSREATIEMASRWASIIVFSEGTFGHEDGRLRAPQLGLLKHAYEAGLSIVPLGHAGTRRALSGDRPPFHRGVSVALVCRPPIAARDYPNAECFARAAWSAVVLAVREARAHAGEGPPYARDPGVDWDNQGDAPPPSDG